MKAIVTGAAGFIGSNIVDRLILEGFDVIAVDNLSAGILKNVNKKAKFIELDIRNLDGLVKISKDCDYFFHCASTLAISHLMKLSQHLPSSSKASLNE